MVSVHKQEFLNPIKSLKFFLEGLQPPTPTSTLTIFSSLSKSFEADDILE
jgi:hypothetical protein